MSARAELQAKLAERDRIASEIAGYRQRAAGLQSRAENAEARADAERAGAAEADALAMAEDRKPTPMTRAATSQRISALTEESPKFGRWPICGPISAGGARAERRSRRARLSGASLNP